MLLLGINFIERHISRMTLLYLRLESLLRTIKRMLPASGTIKSFIGPFSEIWRPRFKL